MNRHIIITDADLLYIQQALQAMPEQPKSIDREFEGGDRNTLLAMIADTLTETDPEMVHGWAL